MRKRKGARSSCLDKTKHRQLSTAYTNIPTLLQTVRSGFCVRQIVRVVEGKKEAGYGVEEVFRLPDLIYNPHDELSDVEDVCFAQRGIAKMLVLSYNYATTRHKMGLPTPVLIVLLEDSQASYQMNE